MADDDRNPEALLPPGKEAERMDAAMRSEILRSLLLTFIALTVTIAIIAFATGSSRRALISLTGGAVYALLLVSMRRWSVGAVAYLTTSWYLLIATAAMANGRGIHDVTLALFPAGILMGSMLLEPRHLVPLVATTTAIIATIGVIGLGRPLDGLGPSSIVDVLVVSLLMVVSGVLTWLIGHRMRSMLRQREKANAVALRSNNELEERNQSLQLMNRFADTLQRDLEKEAIARETVDLLRSTAEAPLVAFYLLGANGTELELIAHEGFTEAEWSAGKTLSLEGTLSGAAIAEGRPVLAADLRSELVGQREIVASLAARGMVTVIAIPLIFGTKALGTMNMAFAQKRDFKPIELETLQAMAQSVSLALTNAGHLAGIEHQAYHDALTSLPNRLSLHQRFVSIQEHATESSGRIGLIVLDLRRFREINEALGHSVGDELLVEVANRLSSGREGKRSEIFRLSGDEFAVLLCDVGEPGEAAERARLLHAALKHPCEVGGIPIDLDASVGVAIWPEDGQTSQELLRCADVAMDRAKQTGRSLMVYSRQLDQYTPERLGMMADLGRAIRANELELHFQPIVSLESGSISGFEALVRWRHPRLGLLCPADFVLLAETTDLINPLTWWVTENALIQLSRWNATASGLTMAINLSARNLLDSSCAETLNRIVSRVGVEPRLVEFEITETAVMTDPGAALPILRQITSSGVRLAIDDFGTGYSSLAYLQQFPLHGIKIDRSFVIKMTSSDQSHAIVKSTVQLAQQLGLTVVAEGIEDQQTADALRRIGCDFAQGYFFGAPAPADQIRPWATN